MRVLIVGAGGREHALAWKLAQAKGIKALYCTMGNPGIAKLAECLQILPIDFDGLAEFAKARRIDLVVIGPEVPLINGIVDYLTDRGIACFGPSQAAAQLEGSKLFGKKIMADEDIDTAPYRVVRSYQRGECHLKRCIFPKVIKADEVRAGKGVRMVHSLDEGLAFLKALFSETENVAPSRRVLIEDCLTGPELSVHAVSDGTDYALFPFSRDYKRITADPNSPNSGGMGAICTVPGADEKYRWSVESNIIHPTIHRCASRGHPFVGCLFPGVICVEGIPWVLEYNVRFGDPETQVYMRLLKTDLLELLTATCITRRLGIHRVGWDEGMWSVCVVLASAGYPDSYQPGKVIRGLRAAAMVSGVEIFHAGTADDHGVIKTAAGRVLNVTAVGASLDQARERAYEAVRMISFEGMQYRSDIGQ